MDGVRVDLERVQTNLVFLEPLGMTAAEFVARCRSRRVLGGAGRDGRVRFVTHAGIGPGDVQRALEVCSEVLEGAAVTG
jgi:threonine aldolase